MAKRPTFFHHLHPPAIPAREARFRYTFGLGGISILLFLILLLTGALELFYYIPSVEEANSSLHVIDLLVPYGQLVRSLHYWAAQALVVTSVFHLLRVTFTGSYKTPRRFNWLLGLTLLVLVLLLDFTGYALRWDSGIVWALTVGTNLLKSVPLIGLDLYGLAVGGVEIGPATVVRLYGWHVYGLAGLMLFFMAWHIFRVRRDGGISKAASKALVRQNISRSELMRREAIAALATCIVLLAVAALFPPALGAAADFENLPIEAGAPWFFLWIQQLLRLGSPFLMGVLLPLLLFSVLALIPYLIDRRSEGTGLWFNRQGRAAQLLVVAIMAFVLGLIFRGALK